MARITFERIQNPNIIGYDIIGIKKDGTTSRVTHVENPKEINLIKIDIMLTPDNLVTYSDNKATYEIKYKQIAFSSDIAVQYNNELIDNQYIVYNAENNAITILTGVPKDAELIATISIDGIEVIIEEDEYINFIIKPIIDAQNTLMGYHSELI